MWAGGHFSLFIIAALKCSHAMTGSYIILHKGRRGVFTNGEANNNFWCKTRNVVCMALVKPMVLGAVFKECPLSFLAEKNHSQCMSLTHYYCILF